MTRPTPTSVAWATNGVHGLLLIAAILISCVTMATGIETVVSEVCYWETFSARCPPGHVVVMTRAVYGRMQLGRCVTEDMGYLGCQVNVLDLAHAKCSGRGRCDIKIPDPDFDNRRPCKALQGYMEASYICEKVEDVEGSTCLQSCDFVRLAGHSGYLSSWVTEQTGCGSTDCPWMVTADGGQTVRLSLVDFGKYTAEADRDTGTCKVYVVIRDTGSPKETTTMCGGRRGHLADSQDSFVSKGNEVEIRIMGNARMKDGAASDGGNLGNYFLLRYEVLGCPDILPPVGATVDYSDSRARVQCLSSDTKWDLRCNGSHWTGHHGNCSDYAFGARNQQGMGTNIFSATSLAIIISVAFVICTLVLVVGLICYRICSRNLTHSCHGHDYEDPPDPPCAGMETVGYHMTYAARSGEDYEGTLERQKARQTLSPEKYRALYGEGGLKHHYEHICDKPSHKVTGYVT
nr:Gal-binding and CUB domains containing receptor 16 [Arenicola marina]